MQSYLTHLLQDLKAAQNNQPEKPDYKVLYQNHPTNAPECEGHLDHLIEWELGL